jgi:hypothetical protein
MGNSLLSYARASLLTRKPALCAAQSRARERGTGMNAKAKANKRARAANAARERSLWEAVPVRPVYSGGIHSNSGFTLPGQPADAGDATGIAYSNTDMRSAEKPSSNTMAKSAVWRNGHPLDWKPGTSVFYGM